MTKTKYYFSATTTHDLRDSRQAWEAHWTNALSDIDLDFLSQTAHVTAIRIPIGYFTLPGFCASTPFAPFTSIYENAWPAILTLCKRLHNVGIGVLLDLHALPGGANDQNHSGTSTHKAELWGNKKKLDLAKRCLLFLASEVAQGRIENCVGIQLCNEAAWSAREAGLYAWYADVAASISDIDASIPLYISDAWDLPSALEWCGHWNRAPAPKHKEKKRNPVIAASSKYYCFTPSDHSKSPEELTQHISANELHDLAASAESVVDKGAREVAVTEYSCALDPASWAKSQGDRDSTLRRFGQAQVSKWQRACGAFFWTACSEGMRGSEWDFNAMVEKGVILAPGYLSLSFDDVCAKVASATAVKEERKNANCAAHVSYWNRVAPGGDSSHVQYGRGWEVGWGDARAFFAMRAEGGMPGTTEGADRIGALECWILKRLREGGVAGGEVWEWEHGFRSGVGAFERAVL